MALAFPLLAVSALAQDPAAEILTILSDRASSPLDYISSSGLERGADEMDVLDLLSENGVEANGMGALDFVTSSDLAGTGALDFISSTIAGTSLFTAGNGYGMNGSAVFPFAGQRITSLFGYRPKFGRMHKGIDLAMEVGDTVRVPLPGTVRKVSYEARGYGHYVTVVHDNGMETRYAHLSHTLVTPGQRLDANQPIAISGNSGNSTGPHLHFETRYLGTAINPADVFSFTANYGGVQFPSDSGGMNSSYSGAGYRGSADSRPAHGVSPAYYVSADSRPALDCGANGVSASSGKRTYVVRQGDTLRKIARKTGLSVYRLCQLNFITESAPLEPGRMLKLR